MEVQLHAEARKELARLSDSERRAIYHALEKLEEYGARLSFPHASRVQGAGHLFELRPRAGRSPWRAFYRQIGGAMVIGSIGPEAETDRRAFDHAVKVAERRLAALQKGTN